MKYMINGKAIDDGMMALLASYMDDDIRESLHRDLAPCTHDEFIAAYIDKDPEFETFLNAEFSVDELADGDVITVDSFGSRCPVNWQEIAGYLNAVIAAGTDPEQAWETYCSGGYESAPECIWEGIA